MNENDAPIFIYKTHQQAEDAIRRLMASGFDPRKLSLVGKGYHSELHPVGFYTSGDRVKAWGKAGAFWGGFWGLLFAPAVFFLPGLGLVAMAGPFVSALVGVLEGAVLIGGVSALGAALIQLGVPQDQVVKYENALTVDGYVLMVHGDAAEARKAHALLLDTHAAEVAAQRRRRCLPAAGVPVADADPTDPSRVVRILQPLDGRPAIRLWCAKNVRASATSWFCVGWSTIS